MNFFCHLVGRIGQPRDTPARQENIPTNFFRCRPSPPPPPFPGKSESKAGGNCSKEVSDAV